MRKALAPGEYVVVSARPQARRLIGPASAAVLLPLFAGFGAGWLSKGNLGRIWVQAAGWKDALTLAVVIVAAAVFVLYCLRRFMAWWATRYTLTSRRIIVRRGWLNRNRSDLPLAAIRNLGTRQSGVQRILRCGTITLDLGIEGAAGLDDVPEVARFRDLTLAAIEDLPHTALAYPGGDVPGTEYYREEDHLG
jgi:membrane protein YdbS with pleckstrin-like domain